MVGELMGWNFSFIFMPYGLSYVHNRFRKSFTSASSSCRRPMVSDMYVYPVEMTVYIDVIR